MDYKDIANKNYCIKSCRCSKNGKILKQNIKVLQEHKTLEFCRDVLSCLEQNFSKNIFGIEKWCDVTRVNDLQIDVKVLSTGTIYRYWIGEE